MTVSWTRTRGEGGRLVSYGREEGYKVVSGGFKPEGGTVMEDAWLWLGPDWEEGRAYAANIWRRSKYVNNPFVSTSVPCSAVPAPATTTKRTPVTGSTSSRFVLPASTPNPVPSSSWGPGENTNNPAQATAVILRGLTRLQGAVVALIMATGGMSDRPSLHCICSQVTPRPRSHLSFQLSLQTRRLAGTVL